MLRKFDQHAGGVNIAGGASLFYNNDFWNNTAALYGGAMAYEDDCFTVYDTSGRQACICHNASNAFLEKGMLYACLLRALTLLHSALVTTLLMFPNMYTSCCFLLSHGLHAVFGKPQRYICKRLREPAC